MLKEGQILERKERGKRGYRIVGKDYEFGQTLEFLRKGKLA